MSFGDGFLDCGGNLLGLSSNLGFILGDGFDVRHKRSLDIGMIKRSRLDVCMSIGADFSLGDCLLFQLLLLLLLDVLVVIDRSMILGGCFAVVVLVASFDRGRSEFWISAEFLHIHLHNIRWFSLEASQVQVCKNPSRPVSRHWSLPTEIVPSSLTLNSC